MSDQQVPARAWFSALALGCFGIVVFGLGLQEQYRLAPCPLCIFQRLLLMVVGCLAFFGLLLPFARRFWGGLIAASGLLGFAVAAYQTWMQAFPESVNECSYSDPNLIERLVDWLGMQLPSLFLATGFCTSKEWVFLKLSLANWSLFAFGGIVLFALWMFVRRH